MDLFLNNKTALITGASKGIGKAIAESLAQEGCNLALTARSGDMLEDVRATLQKKHNISVEIFPIDLSLKMLKSIFSISSSKILASKSIRLPITVFLA